MRTSEVLYGAADYLSAFGHWKGDSGRPGGDYATTPRCVVGAIGACGDEVTQGRAREAVRLFLGGVDSIVNWNDRPGRTAAEVIEVLRAAAVIEAARESEAAKVGVSA